jgi:hypothetical protein
MVDESSSADLAVLALIVGQITVTVREDAEACERLQATTAAVEATLRAQDLAFGVRDGAVERVTS